MTNEAPRTTGEKGGPAYREYALVLVVLAIAGLAALALFGGQTSHVLSAVSGSI